MGEHRGRLKSSKGTKTKPSPSLFLYHPYKRDTEMGLSSPRVRHHISMLWDLQRSLVSCFPVPFTWEEGMEGTLSTSLWQHQCLQPPSTPSSTQPRVVSQTLPSECLEAPVLPGAPKRSLLCRVPVCTIFETDSEDGICAIAISQDAKYLVTISAAAVQVKRIFPLS